MSQILLPNRPLFTQLDIAICLVWLFHLSGMIGISIGFEEWFVPKTPINLSLVFVLVLLCFPKLDRTFWLAFLVFFSVGMIVEWIGVQYGFLFGGYSYGNNLGPKIMGVPWFIGLNWGLLTIISGVIATHRFENKWVRIICGAGLMVLLDLFLEHAAPRFDYWTFDSGLAPLKNYIAWSSISVLFHLIYQHLKLEGDTKLSYHLYGAQLAFFIWFYGFYHL